MNEQLTERQRFWRDHVKACHASGGTMKAYAAEQGLALAQLYAWKSRLTRMGALSQRSTKPGALVPVRVVGDARDAHSARFCRIHLSDGIGLEWPLGADASELGAVVRALETRR